MVVMTAKLNKKKLTALAAAVLAVVVLLVVVLKDRSPQPQQAEPRVSVSTNEDRVKFLSDFGWQVSTNPTETQCVIIPKETSQVLDRYNALQISQGYDLTQYAGKNVTRYVYEVKNYPGATEPVYATLLIYKGEVIGGDVTSTAADGVVQGFKSPA